MLVTKGIILETLTKENKLNVRVPLFESAGSTEYFTLSCTICYNPGNLNSYNVGDVVYITFEDNDMAKAVVIGKLYLGEEKKATNFSYANDLEVENSAILPTSTKIGGVSLEKIINNIKENVVHSDQITQLFERTSFVHQIIQTTKDIDLTKMQSIYGTNTKWEYKDSGDIRTWTRTE